MVESEQESLPGVICPMMSRMITYKEHQQVELSEEEREARLKNVQAAHGDEITLDDISTHEYKRVEVRELVKQPSIGKSCALWDMGRCGPKTFVHSGRGDFMVFDLGRIPQPEDMINISDVLRDTGIRPAFTLPTDSMEGITPGPSPYFKGAVTGTIESIDLLDKDKED